MTLNITKKKIEKVLELFNHPQTRKISKNRGKKRRKMNKSSNRKNGRKNLATSTLKKKGGQAGHLPYISNGGQVGVVLGGQVGGKTLKTIFAENMNDTQKSKFIINGEISESVFKKIEDEYNKLKNGKYINNEDISNEDIIKESINNVEDTINNEIKDKSNTVNNNDIKDDIKDENNTVNNTVNNNEDNNEDNNENNTVNNNEDNTVNNTVNNNEIKDKNITPKVTKLNEIDTSEMLKVALASNYFTQYGILSGMLKMNQEKDKNKFDVMKFVQDPKLYAEFCNKMGFQFAETSEDTVVENKDDKNNDE